MKTLRKAIEDAAWEMQRTHNWGMTSNGGQGDEIDSVLIDTFVKHVSVALIANEEDQKTEEEFTREVARMARRRLAAMGFTTEGPF